MKYPQYWGAIGDHSGDAYFEFCYLPDWPRTLNELDRYRKPFRRAGRQNARPTAARRRTAATTVARGAFSKRSGPRKSRTTPRRTR